MSSAAGPCVMTFSEIAACAIDLRERDERTPKIVTAAMAEAERGEIGS